MTPNNVLQATRQRRRAPEHGRSVAEATRGFFVHLN
jgi:hypothetical protein